MLISETKSLDGIKPETIDLSEEAFGLGGSIWDDGHGKLAAVKDEASE